MVWEPVPTLIECRISAMGKTYFLNQVFLKFSALHQDNSFSDAFRTTSLAVIQELEPEPNCNLSSDSFSIFFVLSLLDISPLGIFIMA